MLLSVLYAFAYLLADLALVRCPDGRARDAELLALRHEVRVLRRRVKRAAWRPGDRFLLTVLGRRLPRAAWGALPVRGELLKLGREVSATAIRSVLRRRGVPPAPRRSGLSWRAFLRAHAGAVLECDFFTVETIRLRTLHVLL